MDHRVFIQDIQLQLNRDMIFHRIDCYPESPVYEDVVESYNSLVPWVVEHVQPKAVLAWDEETSWMYLLTTLGSDLEKRSTHEFETGDYLAGILIDAMADDLLFAIENCVSDHLRAFCAELKKGILRRLEAPKDLPMDVQKRALDVCGVESLWNMSITSGLMYSPVKSNCVVFELTDDMNVFHAQHDCNNCPAVHCKMGKR